jgi:hypothetical protein
MHTGCDVAMVVNIWNIAGGGRRCILRTQEGFFIIIIPLMGWNSTQVCVSGSAKVRQSSNMVGTCWTREETFGAPKFLELVKNNEQKGFLSLLRAEI